MYDGINRSPILNQFAIDGLNENMSIIAIDETTNKVLGVCINQTARPKNVDPETELQMYLNALDGHSGAVRSFKTTLVDKWKIPLHQDHLCPAWSGG